MGVAVEGRHAFDRELQVADGTDIEGDVIVEQARDGGGGLDGADAVLDAGDLELIEDEVDEGGGHEFAGVGFGEFAGGAGAAPDVGGPRFDGEVFPAVEVDAVELGPGEGVVDELAGGAGVVVVGHAAEDAEFEAARGGGADGADDLGAGFAEVDEGRGGGSSSRRSGSPGRRSGRG